MLRIRMDYFWNSGSDDFHWIRQQFHQISEYIIHFRLKIVLFNQFLLFYFFQQTPLKKGSPIADSWKEPPITPFLKFYFFNVTNSQEFLEDPDVKPILKEIGPFVYE